MAIHTGSALASKPGPLTSSPAAPPPSVSISYFAYLSSTVWTCRKIFNHKAEFTFVCAEAWIMGTSCFTDLGFCILAIGFLIAAEILPLVLVRGYVPDHEAVGDPVCTQPTAPTREGLYAPAPIKTQRGP